VNFNNTVKLANPENSIWCKNVSYISYTSPVIAICVFKYNQSNKGRSELNYLTPKNPLFGANRLTLLEDYPSSPIPGVPTPT